MNKPPLALPWTLSRGLEAGDEILAAIQVAIGTGEDPKFIREGSTAILDWKAVRVFYRIALDPEGKDHRLEWGYWTYAAGGLSQELAGHWSLSDVYRLKEELMPSAWGPGAIQTSFRIVMEHIVTHYPEARLIRGVVAPKDTAIIHNIDN